MDQKVPNIDIPQQLAVHTGMLAGSNAALIELARKASGTEVEVIKRERDGDVPVLVVDNGRTLKPVHDLVKDFEKTQPKPYRRRGTYMAADLSSLLAWMEAHCSDEAPVFAEGAEKLAADWKTPKLALTGIGNYSVGVAPAWHDFKARFEFPVTLAWARWVKSNCEVMDQADFAEFVESHLYEFSEPARGEELPEPVTRMIEALGGAKMVGRPGDIYEMARGVKLTVSEKVEIELDRSSGEAKMRFSEEHTGAGGRPVKIPKFFYIRLPIFFGEPESLVGALLRYRNAGGGKVMWSYELFAPDLVVGAAFARVCTAVKTSGRTLYLGTPDNPPA